MRRCGHLFVALAATAAASPAAASAAPVLVVTRHDERVRSEPIPQRASRMVNPAPAVRSSARPSVALAAGADSVRRAVVRAAARHSIDAADKNEYLDDYASALRAYRLLGGQRRSELGYVIGVAQGLARSGRLEPSRMPIVFLTLRRNAEWWRKAGPPGSGRRIQFGGSRVIFQYFPGRGLQFHPLGNFGLLNGYWYGHKDQNLRSLADDLVSLSVVRAGFVTWEYYFAFGGGSPPWISGMAQGTAMQALARASERLGDARLLAVAKRARGAFARRTPVGVRVPAAPGAWYSLYSFDPHQNVLNGQLQAVNGLRTYAEYANDGRAQQLFSTGDRLARSVIHSYDTGAWSLYNRPFGRPGYEADLNYHTLNRDFARNLCKGTNVQVYCHEADRFTRYLKEDPTFDPYRAVPSPARAGRGVRVKFDLSKISKVAIAVRSDGKSYYSNSATLTRGRHFFRWVPPMFESEHTYTFQLSARDLAGNGNTVEGELRVQP